MLIHIITTGKKMKEIKEKGLKVFGLDLAHTGVYYLLTMLVSKFILNLMNGMSIPGFQDQMQLELFVENNFGGLQSVAYKLVIVGIILLALLLLNWTYFKGMLWTYMLNKKLTKKLFKKLLIVNSVIMAASIIAFMILVPFVGFAVQSSAFTTILIILVGFPLGLFLINIPGIIYINLIKHKNYIKKSIEILKKAHKFYLAYVGMGLLYVVLGMFAGVFMLLNQTAFQIASYLTITIFFTINKFVLKGVIDKL